MRKFCKKIGLFFLGILIPFIIGVVLPTTPRVYDSLLFAYPKKIERAKSNKGSNLFLLGGSNLSFGIDSKMFVEKTQYNPINMGIHSSLGLKFIIESAEPVMKSGDIVLLVPEYHHFYKSATRGSEELLRMILDVDYNNIEFLNALQVFNCLEYFPDYVYSKLEKSNYGDFQKSKYYSINSFNIYGDVEAHWNEKQKDFLPMPMIQGELNFDVIDLIKDFIVRCKINNIDVVVSYPAYQESSFNLSSKQIYAIENAYQLENIYRIGSPKRYSFPDSLFFNTPYHLSKRGVDLRTNMLIEDLMLH